MQWIAAEGLLLAAGVALALAAYYAVWALRTKRRTGSLGLTQRSRLTCSKCGRQFDYDWVPGAALFALRLGTNRYMSCPLCGAWSTFDIKSSIVSPPSRGPID